MGKFMDIMSSSAGGAIAGGASDLIGGVIEGINYRKRSREAHRRQKELMGIQQKYQSELNRQGADLSFMNWERTSYPAQLAMMKKAGLSPGLMYGQGGGQGGTTQGSGGSAMGGSAPIGNLSGKPMDIMNSVAQGALLKGQVANLNKDLEVKDAGIEKTNVETNLTSLKSVTESIIQAQQKLENARKRGENEFLIKQYEKNLEILTAQRDNIEANTKKQQADVKGIESQIDLNNARMDEINQSIKESWSRMGLNSQKVMESIKHLEVMDAQAKKMVQETISELHRSEILNVDKVLQQIKLESGITDKDNAFTALGKQFFTAIKTSGLDNVFPVRFLYNQGQKFLKYMASNGETFNNTKPTALFARFVEWLNEE